MERPYLGLLQMITLSTFSTCLAAWITTARSTGISSSMSPIGWGRNTTSQGQLNYKSIFFLFWRNWNWEKIIFLAGGLFFGGRAIFFEIIFLARGLICCTKERRNNNAMFSGHYVCPRTHNVRVQALRSHQQSWWGCSNDPIPFLKIAMKKTYIFNLDDDL